MIDCISKSSFNSVTSTGANVRNKNMTMQNNITTYFQIHPRILKTNVLK